MHDTSISSALLFADHALRDSGFAMFSDGSSYFRRRRQQLGDSVAGARDAVVRAA